MLIHGASLHDTCGLAERFVRVERTLGGTCTVSRVHGDIVSVACTPDVKGKTLVLVFTCSHYQNICLADCKTICCLP